MSPQESDSSQQEPEPKGWTVIRVTLSLPGPTWPVPEGDARTAFWTAVLDRRRRYGVLPPGMDAAPPVAPPTYMIDEEKSIRSKFAAALKNRVEPYLRQIGRRRPSVIERVRRGATATTSASGKATGFDLEIERISYDSLSVILKVCGLEEYAEAADSLLPLITHLFALYAPSALNEALLGPKMPDLGFTAMAQAGLPPGLAAPDQGKADGMVTLWRIAGGSLLLPLLLALGVLFLAFTAVRESGTLLTE
jgi:hypothetical protein